MREMKVGVVKLSPCPSSIDMLSLTPVTISASMGAELGTAQPQLVYSVKNTFEIFIQSPYLKGWQ